MHRLHHKLEWSSCCYHWKFSNFSLDTNFPFSVYVVRSCKNKWTMHVIIANLIIFARINFIIHITERSKVKCASSQCSVHRQCNLYGIDGTHSLLRAHLCSDSVRANAHFMNILSSFFMLNNFSFFVVQVCRLHICCPILSSASIFLCKIQDDIVYDANRCCMNRLEIDAWRSNANTVVYVVNH